MSENFGVGNDRIADDHPRRTVLRADNDRGTLSFAQKRHTVATVNFERDMLEACVAWVLFQGASTVCWAE